MYKKLTRLTLFLIFLTSVVLPSQAQILSESFDGGIPADWQALQMDNSPVTASSNWIHTNAGPMGGGSLGPLASSTANNGWMIFDSDLNCNMTAQDVWLISPSMDCTAFSDVLVNFQTRYANYYDQISLQVSTDNMGSWTEYLIAPDVLPNEFLGQIDGSENPVEVTISISDVAANQSDVIIAFRFLSDETTSGGPGTEACAYSWQIDDVLVTDENPTPMFDMRTNANFYAIPPSVVIPASQVESFGFLADVQNVGQLDATNVNLNLTIETNAGEVHSQDLSYGTIAAGALDENRIFPQRYTPPATPNVLYTGTYVVSMSETDENAQNDSLFFDLVVSDSVFAKEFVSNNGIAPGGNSSGSWTVANHYYVTNGDDMACSSVLFGVANADEVVGAVVSVFLYEWVDLNGDSLVQASERDGTDPAGGRIVGNALHTISATDNDVQVVLENWDDETLPVFLKDNTHYILAVESTVSPPNTGVVAITGSGFIDYGAMSFVAIEAGAPRYGAFWNPLAIGNDDVTLESFDFAPRIRMHINPTMTIATNNQLAPENKMNIFPNPVEDVLQVELDFVQTFDVVNVEITDAAGKLVLAKKLEQVQQEVVNLNVKSFSTGLYFIHLKTSEGVRTKKFIK